MFLTQAHDLSPEEVAFAMNRNKKLVLQTVYTNPGTQPEIMIEDCKKLRDIYGVLSGGPEYFIVTNFGKEVLKFIKEK